MVFCGTQMQQVYFTNKSDIRSILKRKGASSSKKILENKAEMDLLIPETGTELFAAYQNLLEEEAAEAYEQEITQFSLDKGRQVMETARMVYEKLGRKVKKGEMERILRWLDEDVEPGTICEWVCGTSPKGLIGHDFEDYLTKNIGGNGSFSVGGRDFDGGIGNRWWEAKSGQYWDMLENNPKKLAKFKSDMGHRLKIATENGATYELFSNTPIPDSIKQWLTQKNIPYTELLD